MANMKQIAAKAGVSLGTVSHVLNNSARVREELKKKVLDAVNVLGYQPSELARGLRRDKTNMIGMIIPDVTNPFFPAVVRGAEDVAFANGYRLVLCNTDNDHAKELVHLQELRTYLPAGLIVIPSTFSDLSTQANSYRKAGSAVICIDRLPRHWEGDSVTVANEEGAYQATKYLIRLGHRRLATHYGSLAPHECPTTGCGIPSGCKRGEAFDRSRIRARSNVRSCRRPCKGVDLTPHASSPDCDRCLQRHDRSRSPAGHRRRRLALS